MNDINNYVIHHTAHSCLGPPSTYTSSTDSSTTVHVVTVHVLVINKRTGGVLLTICDPNGAALSCITCILQKSMCITYHSLYTAVILFLVLALSFITIGQLCDADCAVLSLTNTISLGYKIPS
jgi:hypothetical protein